MLGSRPSTEVGAAFGDEAHSQVGADSMDLGEIDASELVHESAHVEAQRVGLLGPAAHLSQWLSRYGLVGGKHGQRALDLGIAFVDAGLVEVIQCQGLLQREDVFGKVVAYQSGPDRLDAGPQLRSRIAASTPGSRSPVTMARMMRIPVAPVTSVTTWCS